MTRASQPSSAGRDHDAGAPMLTGELDALVGTEQLCRSVRVTMQWVSEHVDEGLLAPRTRPDAQVASWQFDALALRRARRIAHLERHFDAAPELAALAAEIEREIGRLRNLGGR